MAYADDITVFSTNAKDLQRLIDMCTMYSDRWRFKYGIDKSKCMISRNYVDRNSEEHFMLHLLTTSM